MGWSCAEDQNPDAGGAMAGKVYLIAPAVLMLLSLNPSIK